MLYLFKEELMQKNNKNEVTFGKILAIINQNAIAQAENAKHQAETDKQIRELRESQAKTDEQIKITQQEIRELKLVQAETQQEIKELKLVQAETQQEIKITQQEIRETTKGLNKLEKLFGNAQNNLGEENEEFISNTIIDTVAKGQKLWGDQYDHAEKNVQRHSGKTQGQFDFIVFNSHCIAIIEVKSKPHISDIEKFPKMIETFRILYPMYKDFEIRIGIASTNFADSNVIKLCKERGYGVIKVIGNSIEEIPAQCAF